MIPTFPLESFLPKWDLFDLKNAASFIQMLF
jgi:hypothetical protein